MASTAPTATVASVTPCDKEQALSAIETVTNSITAALTQTKATLTEMKDARTQAVMDAATHLQCKAVNYLDAGLDRVLPTVALVSKTFAIPETTCRVTGSLKFLDERYAMLDSVHSMSERLGLGATLLTALECLQSLDQKVTQGYVQPTMMHVYEKGILVSDHVVQKFKQVEQRQSEEAQMGSKVVA